MRLRRCDITPFSRSLTMTTHICARKVDRVVEEDRAILIALAGIDKKSMSEAEDK